MFKKCISAIKFLLIGYLIYAAVFGIAPYWFQKEIGPDQARQLAVDEMFAPAGQVAPDRITLVESTAEAFDRRVELIRGAQNRLDIAYHCVKDGTSTRYFFSQIIEAADRGVKVRLLLDGKVGGMGASLQDVALAIAAHPNIDYRIYNPFHLLKPWQWNSVFHDKFLVADDKLLLMGGRNIGDEYFALPDYDGTITNDRDVLIYNTQWQAGVEGSVIGSLRAYMDDYWQSDVVAPAYGKLSRGQQKKAQQAAAELRQTAAQLAQQRPELMTTEEMDYAAQTVPVGKISFIHNPINAGPKEPWVGYQLLELGRLSQQEILIQSPYIVAGDRLRDAFRQLTANVPVTAVTNSLASSPNYPAFSYYHASRKKLLETGVTFREYQSANSIHGKSYLMDGHISAVGSFNLDDRSIFINTETMLVVDSPEFNQMLTDAVQVYAAQSLTVGADNKYLANEHVAAQPVSTGKRLLMAICSVPMRLVRFLV